MRPSAMDGKVAVITGAVGDIGRAATSAMAQAGATLCLVDSAGPALDALADEMLAVGCTVLTIEADLTKRDACRALIARALKTFGRLDALCNVANAFLPSPTAETSQEAWEFSLAFNISAPFYLMQAALPELIERGGAIVNVTSCAAYRAHANTAAYSASKAGLLQMTKAIAAEYRDTSVRINLISPGDLSPHSGSISDIPDTLDITDFQKGGYRPPVTAAQVGQIIAFLASDAASGFHGACIALDNGIGM